MNKLRKLLRSLRKFLVDRAVRRNVIAEYTVCFPKLHSRLIARYGIYHPENPIDLAHPKFFNEKLQWLKYYVYNKSPLLYQCYDKYNVRDYVRACGCGHILNEVYGVWKSLEDIPWDELPEEYVLKGTNGCGDHVFRRNGENVDINAAKERLRHADKRRRTVFRMNGILFASENPQQYVCEKFMHADTEDGVPNDYKFYCFHGEPYLLLWISERFGENGHKETYKKASDPALDRSELCDDSSDFPVPIPKCYDEMLEIARKLAKPFPFVRVDLYDLCGKPIFGELTFAPGGTHTPDAQKELGDLIHLERKDELKTLINTKPYHS